MSALSDIEWDVTVDAWKAELALMTVAELIASFGPVADEDDDGKGSDR